MTPRRRPLMEISENDAMSSTANATSRRKSGRAVRAPEKFIPDADSSQLGNTNGKRKRGGDECEDDAENEEDDDEDSDEESDAEEEVPQTKKRAKAAKKPVPKKAKVNGTTFAADPSAVNLPNRAKKSKKVAIADATAEGVYASIFTSGDSPNDVAAEWLRQYEADNTKAMTDLVNCILKSSGCDITVNPDDINDPDNVPNKLNDLQDEYKDKNVSEYPIISKAKISHTFKANLIGFFAALMQTMHATGVLYDDIALIENIHLWVTSMSSSFLRPFRHTATIIALASATGLCRVAKEGAENTAKALTQLDGEKKKGKGKNQGRIDKFQKLVDTGNERREMCENTISDLFDTVFVHRYRDVDPKIRTDCVEALGQWIMILPKIFLEGAYLRYLGWLLSDHSGPTRHEVVRQLQKIMKNESNIGALRHFIERFRARIVEMGTRDTELNVRAASLDLLDLIRGAGMLEPDDIDVVGKLIFDSELRVRKAVVGFFVKNIQDLFESNVESLGGEDVLDEAFTLDDEDYENPSSGWIKLKCLAEVLLGYDSEAAEDHVEQEDDTLNPVGSDSRVSLAAEVLYDKMPEVRDWEMLAGYLLFDHSKPKKPKTVGGNILQAVKINDKEDVVLLEILTTAVKLGLTHSDDPSKIKEKSKKRKTTTMESAEIEETTARKLATLLPRLLKKFGADPDTAVAVLRLEHVLNLDVFQELRQNATGFKELLYQIKSQFKGHADHRVLKEASLALLHAQTFDDLGEVTDDQIQSLWEDTLREFMGRFPKSAEMTVRGDMKFSPLVEFAHAVTRISKLAAINNPVERFESKRSKKSAKAGPRADMAVIDKLLEVVGRGILEAADPDVDEEEDRLVSSAIQSVLFYFMWKCRSLKQSAASSEIITDLDVDDIKARLESFTSKLIGVLSSRAGFDDLRFLSAGVLLDVQNLFSTLSSRRSAKSADVGMELDDGNRYVHLEVLATHLPAEVQEELTSLFVGAEKQYANKIKKSLEAPDDDDEPEDTDADPEEDEEDDLTAAERQSETAKAERQLCELTGKLVLAIFAGVLDASGPLKGRLRTRLLRNRNRLGQNFSKVVAYLDEPKKSQKSRAQQGVGGPKETKSVEMIDEGEDEDPFADAEPEEGTVEDLRRRELLDEDPPISVVEDVNDDAEEESVLGD